MARPFSAVVSTDESHLFTKLLQHPRVSSESAVLSSAESASVQSSKEKAARNASRRSRFSLLSNFSDFASLIRSHSASTPRFQRPDITNEEFFSGYADHPDLDTQNSHLVKSSLDMPPSATPHEERPSSRKLKSENRLYNFLTRSRSRSRSKNEPPEAAPPSSTMPDIHSSPRQQATRANPASKPASRIPSRPLSSTTTATNTTVTPGTPKPKKQRPGATSTTTTSPNFASDITPTRPTTKHEPAAAPTSRPSTPKHSGARQKLHDLFGIPLGRKSHSRSRPSSPVGGGDGRALRPSLDVPPLPSGGGGGMSGTDDDVTPRPRKSMTVGTTVHAVRPRSRSISPTPQNQTRVLRVTNETSTGSQGTATTSASGKISKFFSSSIKSRSNTPPNTNPNPKRTSRSSAANATLSSSSTHSTGAPILPPIPTLSSVPSLRGINLSSNGGTSRVSSANLNPTHRRSSSAKGALPPLPATQAQPSPPPTIVHSPATPLKSNTVPGASKPATGGSTLRYHAAKGSLDSGYRYRTGAPAMSRLTEEGSSARGSGVSDAAAALLPLASSRDKSRVISGVGSGGALATGDVGQPLPAPVPRPGVKMNSSVRATKHGSFDFERPGWGVGPVPMQRSGSGGTTATGASSVSRDIERERESVYGPGLAGVGTLQREASMRRAQEREESSRLKERARKLGLEHEKGNEKGKERAREKERPSTSQRTTPQGSTTPSDPVHASTSTGRSAAAKSATPTGGISSSTRGATGAKRSLLPKHGPGVKRLIGLSPAQHGPFSFEPAVPSPTRSTSSMGTVHEVPLPAGWSSRAEKERERVLQEKERHLLGKRRSDRAPVPVPSVPSAYDNLSPTASAFVAAGSSPAANGYASNGRAYNGGGSLGKAAGTKMANPNAGHRSGTKGRSLDLGLGLAWAPSKVREAALLPASAFFARTASGTSASSGHGMARTVSGTSSSGGGRSGNGSGSGSGNGLGRSVGGRAAGERDVERSKAGKEVAEVFRSTLDAQGYALFKSYVHQFDAHEIPFDGPTGIVTLVENLLAVGSHLGEDGKRRLVDKFIRILLSQA